MEYANKNSILSLNISFSWPSSSSYLLLPGTPPPPSKPFMICQQEVFVSHLLAPFSFYHFCHFIILSSLTARADFVGASSASRRHFVGASSALCRRLVGALSASRRRIVGACQRLSALIGASSALIGASSAPHHPSFLPISKSFGGSR